MTGDAVSRTAKAEQRGLPLDVRRMLGLDRASEMIGRAELAAALGISPRALRHKLAADRGVSDVDLVFAAKALDDQAKVLTAYAQKLRELVA